jgi:hypothetical protein
VREALPLGRGDHRNEAVLGDIYSFVPLYFSAGTCLASLELRAIPNAPPPANAQLGTM